MNLDTAHFLQDLADLRQIGAYKTGVHRPTYSPDDMTSRRWLMDRMTEIGLTATIDGIGNVLGQHPGAGPKLLVGSHIETQNHAGWLDGALGVVAGLALARAGLAVDVVAFADEEGHYEGGFLGSRSMIGALSDEQIDASRNRTDGTPLRTALQSAGLAGKPRLQLDPARYKGFLELHIEQGTQLERRDFQAGVVTGIVAIWQYRIVFTGQQDHAGGTTMAERRDAGLAAVRLLAAIDLEFPRICGPRTVWTTGRITLNPGGPSIIPGSAEVLFQFRDIEIPTLHLLEQALERLVQDSNRTQRCEAVLTPITRATPAICDTTMMEALDSACESHAQGRWQRMPSGAGHDAQYISRIMPAAMLFTPSIGGISHHWAEDTRPEDLAVCCEILGSAAQALLFEKRSKNFSS